eukprot:g1439.t1
MVTRSASSMDHNFQNMVNGSYHKIFATVEITDASLTSTIYRDLCCEPEAISVDLFGHRLVFQGSRRHTKQMIKHEFFLDDVNMMDIGDNGILGKEEKCESKTSSSTTPNLPHSIQELLHSEATVKAWETHQTSSIYHDVTPEGGYTKRNSTKASQRRRRRLIAQWSGPASTLLGQTSNRDYSTVALFLNVMRRPNKLGGNTNPLGNIVNGTVAAPHQQIRDIECAIKISVTIQWGQLATEAMAARSQLRSRIIDANLRNLVHSSTQKRTEEKLRVADKLKREGKTKYVYKKRDPWKITPECWAGGENGMLSESFRASLWKGSDGAFFRHDLANQKHVERILRAKLYEWEKRLKALALKDTYTRPRKGSLEETQSLFFNPQQYQPCAQRSLFVSLGAAISSLYQSRILTSGQFHELKKMLREEAIENVGKKQSGEASTTVQNEQPSLLELEVMILKASLDLFERGNEPKQKGNFSELCSTFQHVADIRILRQSRIDAMIEAKRRAKQAAEDEIKKAWRQAQLRKYSAGQATMEYDDMHRKDNVAEGVEEDDDIHLQDTDVYEKVWGTGVDCIDSRNGAASTSGMRRKDAIDDARKQYFATMPHGEDVYEELYNNKLVDTAQERNDREKGRSALLNAGPDGLVEALTKENKQVLVQTESQSKMTTRSSRAQRQQQPFVAGVTTSDSIKPGSTHGGVSFFGTTTEKCRASDVTTVRQSTLLGHYHGHHSKKKSNKNGKQVISSKKRLKRATSTNPSHYNRDEAELKVFEMLVAANKDKKGDFRSLSKNLGTLEHRSAFDGFQRTRAFSHYTDYLADVNATEE